MDFYVLWLISLEVTNNLKLKLIEEYENEKNIFDNLEQIKLKYKQVKNINNPKVDELRDAIKKCGISVTTVTMKDYPKRLQEIKNKPYMLFYKGDISLVNGNNLSIVGGRRHSLYGERSTRFIVKEAVRYGFNIVSGGAKGIDSVAHSEALINGGKTIAVLGCGIDIVYPKVNFRLFKEIEKEGLILSEFLPGTEPYANNFPRRNRIISGLSEKLIVTEASNKSGSLITVNYALDQSRDIGVVPSPIFSEFGYGCNRLLEDGATPIISRDTLASFLNVEATELKKGNSLIQNEILNIIRDEPMHIDQIFEKSQVDRNTLYRLLFEMQIKNEVVSLPGNYYARII